MPADVRILFVGDRHIAAALAAEGHQVDHVFDLHPELAVPRRPFDLRPVWRALEAPAELLVVTETLGHQTLPYGMEDLPVRRAYFAIDVHLNFFWQRHYAALFDVVFSAQKDLVPLFETAGIPARWLPWGAAPAFRDLGLPRTHDLSFVGCIDRGSRPKRTAIMDALRRRFGLVSFGEVPSRRLTWDEMARVYASSKIVVNESIAGDLNFRVFEAMACGAMVLTESIGNGLTDLFTPGVHLDVYTPDDLLAKVERYLAADAERERIAADGAAEVAARHTLASRMADLAETARALPRRSDIAVDAGLHWGMTAHLTIVRGLTDAAEATLPAAECLHVAMASRGSAEAAVGLAELLARTGLVSDALVALEAARHLAPANVHGWLIAAELERRAGRASEAAALLADGVRAARGLGAGTRERALDAIAGGVDTSACWTALGHVLQELGFPLVPGLVRHVDAALPFTALDCFVRALAADRTNRAATESASLMSELADVPALAAQIYEAFVEVRPADAPARQSLARLLRRIHLHADAARHERVRAALVGDVLPDGTHEELAQAFHEAALAHRRDGDLERVLEVLDRGVVALPDDVRLAVERSLTQRELAASVAAQPADTRAQAAPHA